MNTLASALFGGFTRRRTLAGLGYVVAGLPIGIAAIIVIATGLATGLSLLVLVIGLPVLWATMAVSLAMARFDARLGRRMIGGDVPEPMKVPPLQSGKLLRSMGLLALDGDAWRSVVWHLARAVLGTVALAVVASLPMVAYDLVVQAGWGVLFDAAAWVRVLAPIGAVALILLIPHVIDAFVALHRWLARRLLGESTRARLADAAERTATAEARADLARDLHDSVGHSVTAALLQASAARRVLQDDPQQADIALAAIEDRGRAALEELDRVLAAMGDQGAAPRSDDGLHRLDELVATALAAGQPLTLTEHGDPAGVPAAVSREGYRVLQEAVTNALRHAAGAATEVVVMREPGRLVLEVNNARGTELAADRSTGGRGLPGLRERVRLLGGTLTSGPTDDGGFRLRAELPYSAGDA